MYFKLGSLEDLPKDIFAKCVSLSSRRPLAESIVRSMASFFYGEYPFEDVSLSLPPVKTEKQREHKKKEKPLIKNITIDKHSCIYEDGGICINRRSVSYGYECERPSSCISQKPINIENYESEDYNTK